MESIFFATISSNGKTVANISVCSESIRLQFIDNYYITQTIHLDNIKIDEAWFETLVSLHFGNDKKLQIKKDNNIEDFNFTNLSRLINFYVPIINDYTFHYK